MTLPPLFRPLSLCLGLAFVQGCSVAYGSMQSDGKHECYKLADSEVDQCLEAHNKSYRDYKQEREKLLNDNDEG